MNLKLADLILLFNERLEPGDGDVEVPHDLWLAWLREAQLELGIRDKTNPAKKGKSL